MGEAGIDRGPAHIQSALAVYHEVLALTATTVVTAATIKPVILVQPGGVGALITMPSLALLRSVGFTPGSQFTIQSNDTTTGVVTVAPNAADTFDGFGPQVVLLPGSSNAVTIQIDATGTKWRFIGRTGMHNRSISAAFAGAATTLAASDIRDTIVLAPAALQSCKLPAVSAMLAAGFQPGQTISIVKGAEAFASFVEPNAADSITGGNVILPADVESGVILQMPAAAAGAWQVLAQTRQGRSTSATSAAATPITLTSSTVRDTNKFATVGALTVELPSVATLIAAGYRIGAVFAFCKSTATAMTITPNGAETIFGGNPVGKAGAGGACILQMPAAAGEWLVLSVT